MWIRFEWFVNPRHRTLSDLRAATLAALETLGAALDGSSWFVGARPGRQGTEVRSTRNVPMRATDLGGETFYDGGAINGRAGSQSLAVTWYMRPASTELSVWVVEARDMEWVLSCVGGENGLAVLLGELQALLGAVRCVREGADLLRRHEGG